MEVVYYRLQNMGYEPKYGPASAGYAANLRWGQWHYGDNFSTLQTQFGGSRESSVHSHNHSNVVSKILT